MSALVSLTVLEPQQDGPPELRALSPVVLSRVPVRGEMVRIDGAVYAVTGVVHVPDSPAEVQLEEVATSTAVSEAFP